jgi:ABC-type Zn2+ transport system substrate-binding protein/surface adhesin
LIGVRKKNTGARLFFYMALPNKYVKKTALKEGQCFICNKSTSTVLTSGPPDFFFVCPGHATDTGFCTPVYDEEKEKQLREAEERKREELRRKAEEGKKEDNNEKKEDKEDEKDKKKDEKDKKKDENKDKGKLQKEIVIPRVLSHYVLHRNIFFLREKVHKDKALKKQAAQKDARASKELSKMLDSLPDVPKS